MAAGAVTWFNNGILVGIVEGNFETDNHYLLLATSGYTPALTHTTVNDIGANECSDPDYAPQNMTGESTTQAAGTTTIDADDVSFGATVTITAKYAICCLGTVAGKSTADSLLFYVNLDTGGGSVSSSAGPFSVNWNASGVSTVAAA